MQLGLVKKEIERLSKPFSLNKQEIKNEIEEAINIAENKIVAQELAISNLKAELEITKEKLIQQEKKYKYVTSAFDRIMEDRDKIIADLTNELLELKLANHN